MQLSQVALQKHQVLFGQASAWGAPATAEVEVEAAVGVAAVGIGAGVEGWIEAEGASRVL